VQEGPLSWPAAGPKDTSHWLAQNAGGPDTGAEGVGQNGTAIPSQRGDAAIADVAMAITPVGPERAGAAVAERLGILARIGRFFKNLLGLEEKIAPSIGPKIAGQMGPRGWTREAIEEAIKSGQQVPAVNKATGNAAIRYIHPSTGQSIVVDTVTNDVIHVGGPGFKYGPGSGDLP
jgi:hypothetical protein